MADPAFMSGFVEAHDSTHGDADMNSSGETLTFIGPWASLDTWLASVGGVVTVVNGSGGVVQLSFPMHHPRNPRWYARTAKWEGIGSCREAPGFLGTTIAYDYAKVQVDFRTWPFPFDPTKAWFSATLDFSADMISIPGFDLFFGDGTRLPNQNYQRRVGKAALRVRRYRVPDVDYLNLLMLNNVGRVNSTAFQLYNLAAGTVLFEGGSTDYTATWGGDLTIVADMSFVASEIPYGSAWNPASHAFELLHGGSSSGSLVYTRQDLNQLLIDPSSA